MIITWHGMGAIKLQEGEVTVVINPHNEKTPKMSKVSTDILLLGEKGMNTEAVKEFSFLIDKPGEYEAKNVFIYGLDANREEKEPRTVFVVEIGGIVVGYLGGLHQGELSSEQLEKFENNDILIIPVGGGDDGLTPKQAVHIINQIEPRIVIPIQHKSGGADYQSVDVFIKEYSVKSETGDKLKITKKDLVVSETKVMVLDVA